METDTQTTNSSAAVLDPPAAEVVEETVVVETIAEEPTEETRPQRQPAKPDKAGFIWGTGRRKSAIARVRIKPGDGKFQVNDREVDAFFSEAYHRTACRAPL